MYSREVKREGVSIMSGRVMMSRVSLWHVVFIAFTTLGQVNWMDLN